MSVLSLTVHARMAAVFDVIRADVTRISETHARAPGVIAASSERLPICSISSQQKFPRERNSQRVNVRTAVMLLHARRYMLAR